MHLSDLQSEYPIDFTLLILSLILAFIAGGKFSNLIKWNPKNVDVQYKSSVMQLVCFLLWSGILISFIVEVLVLGAPPAISMAIRSEYFLSLWGSIVILQSVLRACYFMIDITRT